MEQALRSWVASSATDSKRYRINTRSRSAFMDKEQLLDLAEPRNISFRMGGFNYSYKFNRVTPQDWNRYFDGLVSTSHTEKNITKHVLDWKTPGSDLVRANVQSVDGYVGSFAEREGWRALLPPKHVRVAADLLLSVGPDENTERPLDPFHQESFLRAAWTSVEPGVMRYFTGLVHRFTPMTAEHERKFNRAMSETTVIGSGRNGRTVHPSRQKLFLGMYDELVEAVEGYRVGDLVNLDRATIVREMDSMHKVAAVQQLFNETLDEVSEEQ
jgi:hypothetical protein